MRFLGELYNYEHVESSVIFETLYLLLVFGCGTAEQDVLDRPEDCFRIRLVITFLQTCGHYFDRGSSKRKLDRFLIHFQRYILGKGSLPLDIEFDLQDLFAVASQYERTISNEREENGELCEDIPESDTESGSSSLDGGHEEEGLDEENHDDGSDSEGDDEDEDDDVGSTSDDDDEVRVRQKAPDVDPVEEASFDQELRKVWSNAH
ncbi:hypothetical protein MLD38_024191 [Melastoma candidum]|uniref:Uncharacterized protein n=1 Tax=Melastoma candidum TaxID=119954 RepID=A0ACB9NUJ2_9MYRT|nr:hypothetical protein MLD38_024191 [Melastoma candidum]